MLLDYLVLVLVASSSTSWGRQSHVSATTTSILKKLIHHTGTTAGGFFDLTSKSGDAGEAVSA